MGNCLQCFKKPRPSTTIAGNQMISSSAVPHVNQRGDIVERSETDELLTSSPNHHISSILTEPRSGSFKNKSNLLVNGNQSNITDILNSVSGTLNSGNMGIGLTSISLQHQNPLMLKDSQQVSDNTLNALFEEYKDPSEDAILADGIERLCCDLGFKPDDFAILVLAWCLDASQMCRFTKSEFIHGLQKMNADTIDGIKLRLEQIIDKTKQDSEMFKQLYRFTFKFGLEPMHRILSLEMAIILWRLVFTIHTPDILDRWLNFLDQHPNIRGIPKDTWNMFLNFAETCDITSYDDTEAWPSLFDDFVEYETDRTNQNLKDSGSGGIIKSDALVEFSESKWIEDEIKSKNNNNIMSRGVVKKSSDNERT